LKRTIAAKQNSSGRIARLKELSRDLFHLSDAERTSFKERNAMSPTVIAAPYWDSPGLVTIEIALDEIALEIMLSSMYIPPANSSKASKFMMLHKKVESYKKLLTSIISLIYGFNRVSTAQ